MSATIGHLLPSIGQTATYPFRWLSGSLPKQQLYDAIKARSLGLPQGASLAVSSCLENILVMNTDAPSIERSGSDFLQTLMDQYPSLSSEWLQNVLSGPAASVVYHSFGFATALNVPLGIVGTIGNALNLRRKDVLGDSLVGRLSLAKSLFLTGAGVSFGGVFRPLSIFDSIKGISVASNSASLVGRVTYGALFIGLIFYAIFFAIIGAISGVRIFEGAKLKAKLQEAKTVAEQLEILQNKVKVDSKKVFEKLLKKHGSAEALRKHLIQEALGVEKEALRSIMKELNLPEVSEEKLEELVKGIITANNWSSVDNVLEKMGREIALQQAGAKKYDKITRVLNKDGVAAFQEILSRTNLAGRIRSGETGTIEEGMELVERVQSAANTKLKENSMLFALGILGVVAMIAAIVLTAGTGLLVGAALMLALCVIGMVVDGYYLHQSYKEERPATHDKKMLIASSVLALASLALVIGLGASGVITLGIAPLVIALVLTAIWLVQNGVTWAVMNRNKKLFDEKNPTLETFIEALKNDESLKRAKRMLEKLPERKEIDSEFRKNGNDIVKAAEAVAQRVEAARKSSFMAQQEVLRQALVPLMVSAK